MRILVAPDKFRGSLEAAEVCEAIRLGVLEALPDARVTTVPMADGGEGTAAILTQFTGGSFVPVMVKDPLGRSIRAEYGLSGDGRTAFIEMAAASGLQLLAPGERNPLYTSSYGTGQLVRDALERGARKIVLGIGGSATNDGGIGLASALGYRFFDVYDRELSPAGMSLADIHTMDALNASPLPAQAEIIVACDVTNPLYGDNGAASVYGPQKGADAGAVRHLDEGLRNLAEVAAAFFGKDYSHTPGAGAAGGMGAGAGWFLGASLREGVKIVMEQTNLAACIKDADLVITGEGKVDHQTLSGTLIQGIAGLCMEEGKHLLVICGTLQITPQEAKAAGITCAVSVLNRPVTLAEAEPETFERVKEAAFHLSRLYFHQ